MLFALAFLCFLLVNVGANECQCDLEGEDTSCKIPMWKIVRETRKDLQWNKKMYQRAKQETENTVTKTPEYVAAFFYKDFEPTDDKPVDQKVNMTMDRGRLLSKLADVGEAAKFGCYCEHEFGPAFNDMMIYCFFD